MRGVGCGTKPAGGQSRPPLRKRYKECVGEGLCPSRRAGKSVKRRRWRMQRAGFEEVPRLADTTVAGNRLARRWAREPRPYGGVQGVREKNPPGTASPCLPPLGKGSWGRGVRIATTSDIGHWFRNDRGFSKGCGARSAGGQGRPPLHFYCKL